MGRLTKHGNKRYDKTIYTLTCSDRQDLNIGAIIKSAMRKAWVRKGHRFAFGGLIAKMCRRAGVPTKNLDYMDPFYPEAEDITRKKWPDLGPTLTIAERHRRDELIMARMHGLEMLHYSTGSRPSNVVELLEINQHYPLNTHVEALLDIGQTFTEPFDDDIPTNEDNCAQSHTDFEDEMDPPKAGDGAEGNDAMED